MSAASTKATIRRIRQHPALVAWAMYLASVPFYVSASGLPQPSSVMLFVLVPLAFRGWDRRLEPGDRSAFGAIIFFVIWVALVNYGWAFLHWRWTFLDFALYPIYYTFNAAIFLVVLILHRRFGVLLLETTIYALIGIVGFLIVASVVNIGTASRGQLFFNNPNQLGYYALLAASAIALMQFRTRVSRVVTGAALVGCAYLAMLSASRAATLGIGILFALLVFSNPRIIIAGSLLAVVLFVVGGPVVDVVDRMQERTEMRRGEQFSEVRGYDRLWKYKEHLVLGAGEGEYERFSEKGKKREIHSSAATILFSYGVVGMLLFLHFGARVVSRAPKRVMVMLLPIIAYTIAHQGLRFTMLWVVLGLFVAAKKPLPRGELGQLRAKES